MRNATDTTWRHARLIILAGWKRTADRSLRAAVHAEQARIARARAAIRRAAWS